MMCVCMCVNSSFHVLDLPCCTGTTMFSHSSFASGILDSHVLHIY